MFVPSVLRPARAEVGPDGSIDARCGINGS
jgi:hypothetical protein